MALRSGLNSSDRVGPRRPTFAVIGFIMPRRSTKPLVPVLASELNQRSNPRGSKIRVYPEWSDCEGEHLGALRDPQRYITSVSEILYEFLKRFILCSGSTR